MTDPVEAARQAFLSSWWPDYPPQAASEFVQELSALIAAVRADEQAKVKKGDIRTLLATLRDFSGDPEGDHVAADEALLAFIGDEEVTSVFNNLEKWYA